MQNPHGDRSVGHNLDIGPDETSRVAERIWPIEPPQGSRQVHQPFGPNGTPSGVTVPGPSVNLSGVTGRSPFAIHERSQDSAGGPSVNPTQIPWQNAFGGAPPISTPNPLPSQPTPPSTVVPPTASTPEPVPPSSEGDGPSLDIEKKNRSKTYSWESFPLRWNCL